MAAVVVTVVVGVSYATTGGPPEPPRWFQRGVDDVVEAVSNPPWRGAARPALEAAELALRRMASIEVGQQITEASAVEEAPVDAASAPDEPTIGPDRQLPADASPGEPRTGTGTAGYKRPGRPFTKAGKRAVIEHAADQGGGIVVCEGCQTETTRPARARKGSSHLSTEVQVDHIIPQSHGGDGHPSNGRVLCRFCNGSRGNTFP